MYSCCWTFVVHSCNKLILVREKKVVLRAVRRSTEASGTEENISCFGVYFPTSCAGNWTWDLQMVLYSCGIYTDQWIIFSYYYNIYWKDLFPIYQSFKDRSKLNPYQLQSKLTCQTRLLNYRRISIGIEIQLLLNLFLLIIGLFSIHTLVVVYSMLGEWNAC